MIIINIIGALMGILTIVGLLALTSLITLAVIGSGIGYSLILRSFLLRMWLRRKQPKIY